MQKPRAQSALLGHRACEIGAAPAHAPKGGAHLRELHEEDDAHSARARALLYLVADHERVLERLDRLGRVRVELDLAVVQRRREGVAARRDVGEGARVHRELALVALEVLGERQ